MGGVKTTNFFEVIDVTGRTNSYLELLGIEWTYENYGINDLKN